MRNGSRNGRGRRPPILLCVALRNAFCRRWLSSGRLRRRRWTTTASGGEAKETGLTGIEAAGRLRGVTLATTTTISTGGTTGLGAGAGER